MVTAYLEETERGRGRKAVLHCKDVYTSYDIEEEVSSGVVEHLWVKMKGEENRSGVLVGKMTLGHTIGHLIP